jgi:hypothetical protein
LREFETIEERFEVGQPIVSGKSTQYPAICGIITMVRQTRSVVDKRSFGSAGNEIEYNPSSWGKST